MAHPPQPLGSRLADALNRDCHCVAVNREALRGRLEAHLKESDLPQQLVNVHSHLFADSPVFIWQRHIDRMAELIRAVETVVRTAGYRDAVLAVAPACAREEHGPRGVFFSYDFHLGEAGPQLIEINTNAGGVLLALYLAAAQQACCAEVMTLLGGKTRFSDAEGDIAAMFTNEWHLQRPGRTLRTVAIVDTDPTAQFLYPEFLLFQSLFERHGIEVVIADPKEFAIRADALWAGERQIDLVYNRLTDFYLESPDSANLLEAYSADLAVFTPSPHHYALYADKRNLTLLADPDRLDTFGLDQQTLDTLTGAVPRAVRVTPANADQLWHDRKQLFFKPATGHGSRGAYRGAKLTRRVWENICQSDYIAQAIVPPSTRQLVIDGEKESLKLDLRCVTYDGEIQQITARLYQGQTTNLRTKGGGLATVFAIPKGCIR